MHFYITPFNRDIDSSDLNDVRFHPGDFSLTVMRSIWPKFFGWAQKT